MIQASNVVSGIAYIAGTPIAAAPYFLNGSDALHAGPFVSRGSPVPRVPFLPVPRPAERQRDAVARRRPVFSRAKDPRRPPLLRPRAVAEPQRFDEAEVVRRPFQFRFGER